MSDFASAAMLRVILAGMKELGLDPPRMQTASATVSLGDKRNLLGAVVAQRGWAGVLLLGQGVARVRGDPLLPYLTATGWPMQMLRAWQRLERYVHTEHRTELRPIDAQHVQMRHVSVKPGRVPSAAEDLVVLGVLLGLLQEMGQQDLKFRWTEDDQRPMWCSWEELLSGRATTSDFPAWPASIDQVVRLKRTGQWELSWGAAATRAVPTGLGQSAAEGETGETNTWAQRTAQSMRQSLEAAMPDRLDLDAVALHLGCSTRNLQRQLQAEGTKFGDLLARARSDHAARAMLTTPASLAQIGYASGYADQAHFCRDFKRRVGLSPAQYRAQVSA